MTDVRGITDSYILYDKEGLPILQGELDLDTQGNPVDFRASTEAGKIKKTVDLMRSLDELSEPLDKWLLQNSDFSKKTDEAQH